MPWRLTTGRTAGRQERGQRADYGLDMCAPIVVERVEQVLEREPGLGVTLDGEAALKEQRVRVFGTGRHQPEIIEAAADAHIPTAMDGGSAGREAVPTETSAGAVFRPRSGAGLPAAGDRGAVNTESQILREV